MTDSPRRIWSSLLVVLVLAVVSWQLWRTQQQAEDARREAERAQQVAQSLAERQLDVAPANDTHNASLDEITRRLDELESAVAKLRGKTTTPTEPGEPSSEIDALWEQIDELQEQLRERSQRPPDMIARVTTNPITSQPLTTTPQGSNPEALRWSSDQFLGDPDTLSDGDRPTAWASLEPNDGIEWIEIDFARVVTPDSIHIRETYNPGAVVKVEALDADGNYHIVWRGQDPTRESPGVFEVPYDLSFATDSVRITLDTRRVSGWNEIDAVGLMVDGRTYWGIDGEASSSYAERYERQQ